MAKFEALANILVPHRKKVHFAIFILTILMIPGALKALEPIDMESYDMESPELTAERTINQTTVHAYTRLCRRYTCRRNTYDPLHVSHLHTI